MNIVKIIVIDDNQIEHLILQKLFKRLGCYDNVVYSFEPRTILEYISENLVETAKLPDIIFLDLHMPEFSGWDFLDGMELIFPQLNKFIPVVIISSSVDTTEMKRSLSYEFVLDYLKKPVDGDLLKVYL